MGEWIEYEEKENSIKNSEKVLEELKKRYGIKKDTKIELNIAMLIIKEMQKRCPVP